MHRQFLVAVIALTVACSPTAQPAAPNAPAAPSGPKLADRQTFQGALTFVPPTASPESSNVRNQAFNLQFDSLTRFDAKLNLMPGVAEKWEPAPNNSGWRFTLRTDMKWADGTPLTAADVEYTVTNMIANKVQPYGSFAAVTGAKMVDDKTVDMLTRSFDVSVLYTTPILFILPKAYHTAQGTAAFGLKPMGTGPYDMVEFKPGDRISYKLRANHNHPYRKPILTDITWREIPEPTAVMAGLRTGELDYAGANLSPDQVDTIKREGYDVVVIQNLAWFVPFDLGAMERNNSPLKDIRVRQALNYAIDRDAMVNGFYKGYAKAAGQLGLPNTPFWDDSVPTWPYNPTIAKQLLAQAGYPNGFKLAQGIDVLPGSHGQNVPLAVQNGLKEIGVEGGLNPFDTTVYVDRVAGKGGAQRADLLFLQFADSNGMFTMARNNYTCTNPPEARITCVQGFDRNYDLAMAEVDPAKRAVLLKAANKAFRDEVPGIFLLASSTFFVGSPKLFIDVPTSTYYILDTFYKKG